MATRQPSIDAFLAETYGARLFSQLLAGLESHNLSTRHLTLRHFQWLVPKGDASPEIVEIFDWVSKAAPMVTHTDLAKILAMEESGITSPPGLEGFQYFYIRELIFTRQEFSDLVNYLRNSDDGFVECNEWTRMLKGYGVRGRSECNTWTLRYIGTVEGPHRPFDRSSEDLNDQLRNILGETYHAVENVHPHIMRDAKVYLLPDATISPESGTRPEDTERLLVELFHHPSLLNRQRLLGGYIPTFDEAEEFMSLGSDAWQTFKLGTRMASDNMQDALIAHFEEVQQYANDHHSETGTMIHPFTDEV